MTIQEIENNIDRGDSLDYRTRMHRPSAPEKPFPELGIDSLGFVEILVFIEKTFKLQLIASDLTKKDFETIRALATYISKKI